jgi:predicted transcriptional regulator
MSTRGEPGGLEHQVLAVVAGAGGPVTVAQVQQALPGRRAYTTVMTTLSRLAGKGALRQSREGRAYRYTLAAPADALEDVVAARQMRRLLEVGAGKAGVLARFVAELGPEEEQLLAALLAHPDTAGERP